MNEEELRGIVQQMIDAGEPDALIQEVVTKARAQQSQPEEPQLPELTPEEAQNQEIEQHNIRQDAIAGGIAGITGVPKAAIGTAASLMDGFNQILSGLPKAEAALKLTIGEAFNPEEAKALRENPQLRNALYDAMGGDAGNELGETLQAATVRSNAGISELWATGRFGEAVEQTTQQVAAAVPSVLATMTGPGGLAAIGISAMGSSFDETLEKHPEESSLKMLATSTMKAGYEVASEAVTRGILKRAKLIGKAAGPKAAKEATESALKTVFRDVNSEGLSEGLADLAGKLTDAAAYDEELNPTQMIKDFADTYIIGGIVGGGVSTIGVANRGNKEYAKAKMEPTEKAEADKQSAAAINTAADAKKKTNDPVELSRLEDIIADETNLIKERETEHSRVTDELTQPETKQILEDTVKAEELETLAQKPENTPEMTAVYETKAKEARDNASYTYQVAQAWEATSTQAEEFTKLRNEKIKEVEMEEKQAAKSENPNPVGTRKRKKKIKEYKEQQKAQDQALDELRPTAEPAKTRKRKAKAKVQETAKDAPQPIKDKAEREAFNNDVINTINDPSLPDVQKQRAWSEFFKVNAPLVTAISKKINTRGKDYKEVNDLVKTEIANQIIKKKEFDKNVFGNSMQAVQRLINQEHQTVREGFREDIEQQGEGGPIIPDYIEQAYQGEDTGPQDKELIDNVLEGTSVDNLVNDMGTNSEELYALLPKSAKTGKAFSGIFAGGNPPLELWENYFQAEGRQGKDRIAQLKRVINNRIKEANTEFAPSTDDLTASDIFRSGLDALEGTKGKTDVSAFVPLLGKLKRNFPGTRIVISKKQMIDDFIAAGIDPGKADNIKGYTDGNNVVLNPDKLDAETPIHEYGHIWAQTTKQERPDLYNRGADLIQKSSEWVELQEKIKDKDSVYYNMPKARAIEEAMATAIGKHGEQIFDSKKDQSQWDKLAREIWNWIAQKTGIAKVEELTLDQFVKLAATEIVTGEQFVTRDDLKAMETSIAPKTREFLVVPSGTTRDYAQSTPPIVEVDTHKTFKGAKLAAEIDGVLTKHKAALDAGGWIGWTTGSYGDAVKGTPKFNAKLNDRIEGKVNGMRKALEAKGYSLKQDPINPGFHVIKKKPSLSFQESDLNKEKTLNKLLNLKGTIYRDGSPYKRSKIDQATREIINATRRDFALRGHMLNEQGLSKLIETLEKTIQDGVDTQRSKKKSAQAKRADIGGRASDLVSRSSDIKASKVSVNDARRIAREKGKFFNRLKGTRLSNILAPAANNDFYGLLYNMMPKGKSRDAAQSWIRRTLTDPLEKANLNQIADKTALEQNYTDLVKRSGVKNLNGESGIGNYTNSQVAKIYNHMKDPSLHTQMINGGIDHAIMDQVLDYLDSQPQLKQFADGVVDLYAGERSSLNVKLDQHGFKGVEPPGFTAPKEGPAFEILSRIYPNGFPTEAPYTPFTAAGQSEGIDVEGLLKEGASSDFYTVMSGNLKARTRGGQFLIENNDIKSDLQGYIKGPVRTKNYLDFAKNASASFSVDNLRKMQAAYGSDWSDSMRDSLRRIVTGQNIPTNEPKGAKFIRNMLNHTVGGIMFLNMRSATLQLISTGNYFVDNPSAYVKGITSGRLGEAASMISQSDWIKERRKGRTQLETAEVFERMNKDGYKNLVPWLIEKGYSLTQLGDSGAIMLGGAPYVAGLLAQGVSPQQAMQRFVAQSEEVQQSTRPERLGREQTSGVGRAILAFANTPMQYNRKMARAAKDIAAGKDPGHNFMRIMYYGIAQNAMFTLAQKAAFAALDLEDEEEENKVIDALSAMGDTLLRGSGIYGALIATMKNIALATARADERKKADKALDAFINTVPGLGTKARQLKKTFSPKYYALSDGPVEVNENWTRAAHATTFVTNVPLDRALKKFEALNDLAAEDLSNLQKLGRGMGWSRYDLVGKEDNVFKAPSFKEPKEPKAPFNRGETGQAFKDGTIEVDPNQSPAEQAKTRAHEEQHVADMKERGLDYDDNNVYWEGSAFKRAGGKIQYNGQWVPEGDRSLPWEAAAYAAESPLKQDDHDHKNRDRAAKRREEARANTKKYGEKYGEAFPLPDRYGYRQQKLHELGPQHDTNQGVAAGREFTADWEFDPITQERFRKTGLTDEEISRQAVRQQLTHARPFKENEKEGETHHGLYLGAEDEFAFDPNARGLGAVTAHELGHGGFDLERGAWAKDIVGPLSIKTGLGTDEDASSYINDPQEVGGHIQQIRFELGVKPGQKVTRKMLDKLSDKKNLYLRGVRQGKKDDKLIEALNTVASLDKKRTLESIYNA